MEVYSGTIISKKSGGRGYWYFMSSHPVVISFFSRSDIFSLFEKCEVTVERRNNSYFLTDFHSLSGMPPLRKNPENLIAASWLSNLAASFHTADEAESGFIDKCYDALQKEMSIDTVLGLENEYLTVSGFGSHDEHETVLYDCFPYSKKLRESLFKQLSIKRSSR